MDAFFPPGPQKSLLLGDAPKFNQAPLDYMVQAARTYGAIVHFRFGPSHAYLLTNPRDAHWVLVEQVDLFAEKHSLARALNSAMGHDLFPPEERVRKQKLVQGVYNRRWLDVFAEDVISLSVRALRDWQGGDPLPMLTTLARRLVTRTLFGDVDGQLVKIARQLEQTIFAKRDDRSFQSPLTPPLWIPTAQNRRRQQAAAELQQMVAALINVHQTQGRYSVFSCLLQASASQAAAVDEMLALFYAGTEALAHTLAWAFQLLAQNPLATETLGDEIDAALGVRKPTGDDLAELAYADMVLKETLRLYPPVWLVSRQAKREARIGDYYVPSGSTIFISPYVIHHSPRCFTSPEKFLPERYSEALVKHGGAYASLPFGAGRFAASEQSFMLALAKPVLALMAQHYQLTPATTGTPQIEAGLSLRPVGLNLRRDQRQAVRV